jgi:hypothetical protein
MRGSLTKTDRQEQQNNRILERMVELPSSFFLVFFSCDPVSRNLPHSYPPPEHYDLFLFNEMDRHRADKEKVSIFIEGPGKMAGIINMAGPAAVYVIPSKV